MSNAKVIMIDEEKNRVNANKTAHKEQSLAARKSIVNFLLHSTTFIISVLYLFIVSVMTFAVSETLYANTAGLESFVSNFGITDNVEGLLKVSHVVRIGAIAFVGILLFFFHFISNRHNYFRDPKEISSSLILMGVFLIVASVCCNIFDFKFIVIAPITFCLFIVLDTMFDIGELFGGK